MQHVHAGETGPDDHRIERASLLQLGVLIRHAFSEVHSGISGHVGLSRLGRQPIPQASVSSRKADCQFPVTMSWAQLRNWAPAKKASARLAPSSTALNKFAPSR